MVGQFGFAKDGEESSLAYFLENPNLCKQRFLNLAVRADKCPTMGWGLAFTAKGGAKLLMVEYELLPRGEWDEWKQMSAKSEHQMDVSEESVFW